MRSILLCLLLGALVTTSPAGESRSVKTEAGAAASLVRLAEGLADEGEWRAALVHWQAAQELAPDDGGIANSLGGAYLRVGDASRSALQFRRAIRLDLDNAAYHFNLANIEFMLRHDLTKAWKTETPKVLHHALREFREASRLAPTNLEYAQAYAETFYGMSDPDWAEAEAAWEHVLELSPQGREFIYLQLARVNLKRGDGERARAFLGKVEDQQHGSLKRKLEAQADKLSAL